MAANDWQLVDNVTPCDSLALLPVSWWPNFIDTIFVHWNIDQQMENSGLLAKGPRWNEWDEGLFSCSWNIFAPTTNQLSIHQYPPPAQEKKASITTLASHESHSGPVLCELCGLLTSDEHCPSIHSLLIPLMHLLWCSLLWCSHSLLIPLMHLLWCSCSSTTATATGDADLNLPDHWQCYITTYREPEVPNLEKAGGPLWL
jgi:hypothetical protein